MTVALRIKIGQHLITTFTTGCVGGHDARNGEFNVDVRDYGTDACASGSTYAPSEADAGAAGNACHAPGRRHHARASPTDVSGCAGSGNNGEDCEAVSSGTDCPTAYGPLESVSQAMVDILACTTTAQVPAQLTAAATNPGIVPMYVPQVQAAPMAQVFVGHLKGRTLDFAKRAQQQQQGGRDGSPATMLSAAAVPELVPPLISELMD